MTATTKANTGETIVQQFENKIQSKLDTFQHYLSKAYEQFNYYHVMIQETFAQLWQHEEFRLGVYVFGILSFIPIVVFIGFISIVLLFTTILCVFVWSLITFTLISVSCILLTPILIAILLVTGFIVFGFSLYQFLIRLKQQQQQQQKFKMK